ncbi:hypothetical protein GGF31_003469 [Allomyces arbusculus]|nr:hypothetical protein GGF31_003469 [Allomyces arbusculus]
MTAAKHAVFPAEPPADPNTLLLPPPDQRQFVNVDDHEFWQDLYTDFPVTGHMYNQLRPYQRETLNQIYDHVANGRRVINVILPTGAGKSYIIGLVPFILRLGGSLGICRWQTINASNAGFYTRKKDGATKFETVTGREIKKKWRKRFGNLCISNTKTADSDDPCIDFYGSIIFTKKLASLMRKYAIVQIDEIQEFAENDLNRIIEKRTGNQVVITYSAYPPEHVRMDPRFTHVEMKLVDIMGNIKTQRIDIVSTAEDIDFADMNVSSHAELLARASPLAYENESSSVPSTLLLRLYRTDAMFLKTMRLALRIAEDMMARANTERRPGIVVKAGRQDVCKHWAKALKFYRPELRVEVLTSGNATNAEEVQKAYAAGDIDVLFLCKMLSVGWHDSRTSIVCPLGGQSFSSLLQTFGRGNSHDPDFTENVLVISDVFNVVTNFPTKFREYATQGVMAHLSDRQGEELEEAEKACDKIAEHNPALNFASIADVSESVYPLQQV